MKSVFSIDQHYLTLDTKERIWVFRVVERRGEHRGRASLVPTMSTNVSPYRENIE